MWRTVVAHVADLLEEVITPAEEFVSEGLVALRSFAECSFDRILSHVSLLKHPLLGKPVLVHVVTKHSRGEALRIVVVVFLRFDGVRSRLGFVIREDLLHCRLQTFNNEPGWRSTAALVKATGGARSSGLRKEQLHHLEKREVWRSRSRTEA